jgi:hypothetical protein
LLAIAVDQATLMSPDNRHRQQAGSYLSICGQFQMALDLASMARLIL